MNYRHILNAAREAFGNSSRSFSILDHLYNYIFPPLWIIQCVDPLYRIYKDQAKLFKNGTIVWGHLVQANVDLFKSGYDSLPAGIVFSLDPYFENNLEHLEKIAGHLFSLKGKEINDESLRYFSEVITNEQARPLNIAVPQTITDGREVYMTVIMVHRKHLPVRYLTLSWFPVLVNPRLTKGAIILPSKYWAPELIELWKPVAASFSGAASSGKRK